VLVGWIAFAVGTTLFLMAFGLTAIGMPALGELAATDGILPQYFADAFVRQPPLLVAFGGGTLLFLSWIPIGVSSRRVEWRNENLCSRSDRQFSSSRPGVGVAAVRCESHLGGAQ